MSKLNELHKKNTFNFPKMNDFIFRYNQIINLYQFKEGLEYIIKQIEEISSLIDWISSEDIISSGVLKESTWDVWKETRKKIEGKQERCDAVCSLLKQFLQNEVIVQNNEEKIIAVEDCETMVEFVNFESSQVNSIAENYYKKKKNEKDIDVKTRLPLSEAIKLYNNAVGSFNSSIFNYSQKYNIALTQAEYAKEV